MQVEIKLEEISFGLTEATLIYWLSDVGDIVFQEQPLLELSCDKEIFCLFSPVAGIIQETNFRAGETITVDNILGIIETDLELFKPQAGDKGD